MQLLFYMFSTLISLEDGETESKKFMAIMLDHPLAIPTYTVLLKAERCKYHAERSDRFELVSIEQAKDE